MSQQPSLPIVDRSQWSPDEAAITTDDGSVVRWAEAADVVMRLAERIRTFDLGPKDRKSTRLNSSHIPLSRMPSSA